MVTNITVSYTYILALFTENLSVIPKPAGEGGDRCSSEDADRLNNGNLTDIFIQCLANISAFKASTGCSTLSGQALWDGPCCRPVPARTSTSGPSPA